MRSSSCGGMPGPSSDTRTTASPFSDARCAAVLAGVVEEVGEDLLSAGGVDEGDRVAFDVAAEVLAQLEQEVAQAHVPALQDDLAGLDLVELREVAHQALDAHDLALH